MTTILGPGMTFYDVGANFGLLSLAAARAVGEQGNVICVEPLTQNVHIIEHNLRANHFSDGIRLLPIALGNEDGSARFLKSSDSSQGMLASAEKQPGSFVGIIEVTVRRLDTAIREYELPPPNVIKIDVEGGENQVLQGGTETIGQFRPIMFIELHNTNISVAETLKSLNYDSCVPASPVPIEEASGNVHVLAVPRERQDCKDLIHHFSDPAFPACSRCRGIEE